MLGRQVDYLYGEAMFPRTAANGAPVPPDYRRVGQLVMFEIRLFGLDRRPPLPIDEAEHRFDRLAAKTGSTPRTPSLGRGYGTWKAGRGILRACVTVVEWVIRHPTDRVVARLASALGVRPSTLVRSAQRERQARTRTPSGRRTTAQHAGRRWSSSRRGPAAPGEAPSSASAIPRRRTRSGRLARRSGPRGTGAAGRPTRPSSPASRTRSSRPGRALHLDGTPPWVYSPRSGDRPTPGPQTISILRPARTTPGGPRSPLQQPPRAPDAQRETAAY